MQFLGNPQDSLRVVHVAGTSGKTSTCYYLAGLLQAGGYTVGLSVSPHIDVVSERAQINLTPLPDAEYCRELSEFLALLENFDQRPSYFEVLVAFAFWLFARRQVDIAVIEVGLGGLLDGTNVINRPDKICVITDIGFDHTEILGDTIEAIAEQKAGIIQPDNSVYMHQQSAEIETVVQSRAEVCNASLAILPPFSEPTDYQARNMELAQAVVSGILKADNKPHLSDAAIAQVAQHQIPGRMEVVPYSHGQIILDGAHNAQKIQALVRAIKQRYPNEHISLILSFANNKAKYLVECLTSLHELSETVVVTEFNLGQDVPRQPVPVADLVQLCRTAGFTDISTESDLRKALAGLEQRGGTILVTGSLYLVAEIRRVLNRV